MAIRIILGDSTVQDVPRWMAFVRARTLLAVEALQKNRAELQAELNQQQTRYANVRMPGRTDYTATVKPPATAPAGSAGAPQGSQQGSDPVGGCQSVSANSCNAGVTRSGCLARNQINGFYGIPWEWCAQSGSGNPCKNVPDPRTGAELHRCM
jgi:hypothetical protein